MDFVTPRRSRRYLLLCSLGALAVGAAVTLWQVRTQRGAALRVEALRSAGTGGTGLLGSRGMDVGAAGVPGVSAGFQLTASDGRRVSEQTYRGKWLLVYFGFTACPEACPTALLSIGGALDALGPLASRLQPLFITIDPAHDSEGVMARYLTSFDPRIIGLVGTPEQIAAVGRNYRVYEASRDLGHGQVAIDHSSFIYVVDPRSHVAKILTGDLPGHALADELRRLIR